MPSTATRKPLSVTVSLRCRGETVTLTLKHGDRGAGFRPMGKNWRTLRRGDTVRGPDGIDYTVERLMLDEAEPRLAAPIEIESVAAWTATGLRR